MSKSAGASQEPRGWYAGAAQSSQRWSRLREDAESGYVNSTGGPGGGWALGCDLNQLTVRDIYEAIGHTAPFVIGMTDDNHTCPVEATVNRYITEALGSAEETLLRLFGEKRLSEMVHEVTAARLRKTS
ncbi:Rrf2 family transcriptional regulator [Cupriavidus taiwanensis]|uniref:Rrf2 family transcriptional regulator n=1 Tax=Cupriavidus taiwanensis TaxID=164546 RepID=UPI002161D445|nr:Rrf2 family transcriptional regulator [Cupriavidus taiwanensis]